MDSFAPNQQQNPPTNYNNYNQGQPAPQSSTAPQNPSSYSPPQNNPPPNYNQGPFAPKDPYGEKKTSGFAITSMILGILSLLIGWIPLIGWLIIIVAIVLGIVAIKKINNNPNLVGKGFAITGISTGCVGVIFAVLTLISFLIPLISFLIPFFMLFGLVNEPGLSLPEKCDIAPGIQCREYSASDGSIKLLINNGIGRDMNSAQIEISGCLDETGFSAPLILLNNVDTEILIPCKGMEPNKRFRSDLILNYTTTVEGTTLQHDKYGYLVLDVK